MTKSLKQIIKEVRELCEAHGQIESFHYGDTLRLLSEGAINYTTVLMNISRTSVNRDSNDIPIELLVLDRVKKGDNDNQLDSENTTYNIIRDLSNAIGYSTRWREFSDLLVSSPTQKYYDHLPDAVTGHSISITLKMYNDEGICDLPIFDYDFNQPITEEDCDVLTIVVNSDNTQLATKIVTDSDNIILAPNITFIDSDGSSTSVPSGVDITATPSTPTPDSLYNPMKTGSTSYITGDDGDTQAGRNVDFYTLDFTNPYGNTTRFTNDLGGTVFDGSDGSTADYVVDNATKLGWRLSWASGDTFANHLANATTMVIGSYSGFRVANPAEHCGVKDASGVNWWSQPDQTIWSGAPSGTAYLNTSINATTALRFFRNVGILTIGNTTSLSAMFVRNHTY